MEPLVAKPHSPDNKDTAHNCRDVKLDQAYIGSCTGGKITDMIFAANILKGNKVKIPTFVVPGCTEVHADMKQLNLRGVEKGPNEKSIEDVLVDAGCLLGPRGCARLPGRPRRHLRPPATTPKSASAPPTATSPAAWAATKSRRSISPVPLTVAASALTGHVTDPREYVTKPIETGMAGVL